MLTCVIFMFLFSVRYNICPWFCICPIDFHGKNSIRFVLCFHKLGDGLFVVATNAVNIAEIVFKPKYSYKTTHEQSIRKRKENNWLSRPVKCRLRRILWPFWQMAQQNSFHWQANSLTDCLFWSILNQIQWNNMNNHQNIWEPAKVSMCSTQ